MAITKDDIINALEGMKLTELNDLVKAIEAHFNVTASAPVAAVAATQETANEGPTEVNVIITEIGATRIAVIKEVAAITGKNLMDAKKLLDGEKPVIKEKVTPQEAESIKEKLVAVGATVEIK